MEPMGFDLLETKEGMNMKRTGIHITHHKDGWSVKTEGTSKSSRITSTQAEAIEIGRHMAKRMSAELLIHGTDGKIRERNSYFKPDPYPPRG